jgi:phosphatidylglycerophosphatase A
LTIAKWHDGRVDASPQRRRPPLVATIIATSFGAGFMPKAPGHTGTLTAVPMAWALARGGQAVFVLGLALITAVGTWAAEVYVRATGKEDNQQIVVDEVAGYLLTLLLVPRSPVNLVLAFFLFRLFDIWKPQPVRWLDDHVPGGLGVMVDDLAAGVYGGLVLLALEHFGVSARLTAWVHA